MVHRSFNLCRSIAAAVLLVLPALAAAQATPKPGQAAPAIRAKDIQGKDFDLQKAASQAKFVIVDFWASWCEPCKEELPFLNQLYKQYKSKGLVVVGVNIDSTEAKMNGFLKGKNVEFPIIHDPKGKSIASRYQPPTMPTSFEVDSGGKITQVHVGFRMNEHGKKIKEAVAAALGGGSAAVNNAAAKNGRRKSSR